MCVVQEQVRGMAVELLVVVFVGVKYSRDRWATIFRMILFLCFVCVLCKCKCMGWLLAIVLAFVRAKYCRVQWATILRLALYYFACEMYYRVQWATILGMVFVTSRQSNSNARWYLLLVLETI